MKRIIYYWSPVVVWMITIFLFSTRQKVALTDSYTVSFIVFKTLHLIEYAILFLLSYRAFRHTYKKKNTSFLMLALLLTIIFACTDEIHQLFVPTREGKLRDVIIDAIGGGIGWIILTHIIQRARGKLKTWVKRLGFL